MKRSPQEIHLAKQFFDFYKKIPSNKWCIGKLDDGYGRKCALGHLGMTSYCFKNQSVLDLLNLFRGSELDTIYYINDNLRKIGKIGKTHIKTICSIIR